MAEIRELGETDIDSALKRLVALRPNILISGGTSTGKTTFARQLLEFAGKKVNRAQFLKFLAQHPRCAVAMEACATAHNWGRQISELGHGGADFRKWDSSF